MWISVFVLTVILALFILHCVGPLFISYELTHKSIEIKLFHLLSIYRIPFSNITEIQEVKCRIGMLIGLQWINRVFVKSYVMIRLKRGLFPSVRLTPNNPSNFIEQVKCLM